jgi:hypothetical protein
MGYLASVLLADHAQVFEQEQPVASLWREGIQTPTDFLAA